MSAILFLLVQIAHSSPLDELPEASWNWSPISEIGDIKVTPLLLINHVPKLSPSGYLGEQLTSVDLEKRFKRNEQLNLIPEAFSHALPGQLARYMPENWKGVLTDTSLGLRERSKITHSLLSSPTDLDKTLEKLVDNTALLFHWISAFEAVPLSTTIEPATTTRVAERYVFVDSKTDPVLVNIKLGLALVSAEGQILLRYQEHYEVVLSEAKGPDSAGRDLARQVASDVALVLK